MSSSPILKISSIAATSSSHAKNKISNIISLVRRLRRFISMSVISQHDAAVTGRMFSGIGRRLGEDDDSYQPNAYYIAYTFLVVITVLLLITEILEAGKNLMIDASNKYTRPVYWQLFAEIAVLGFLSLIAFSFNAFGTLDYWSQEIYGNSEYLADTFGKIQYVLLLVAATTAIQVYLLVRVGNSFAKEYEKWNDMSIKDRVFIKPVLERLERAGHVTWEDWFADYFMFRATPWGAWSNHVQREKDEAVAQFYAMRREFIMNRLSTPPYEIPPKNKWLPSNFDYATYQANCVSSFFVSVVTFTPLTWVAVWLFLALIFLFLLIVDGQYLYLSIVWVGLGYINIGLLYLKDRKAESVVENLINPAFIRPKDAFPDLGDSAIKSSNSAKIGAVIDRLNKGITSMQRPVTERTPLVGNSATTAASAALTEEQQNGLSKVMRVRNAPTTVPGWVTAEPVQPGFLTKLLFGHKALPNKQHALMWGDLVGPEVQTYILRVFLLIQSLYISVLAVYFAPYMYYNYGYIAGTVYLFLAIVPEFILYLGFYPRLIMNTTLIASTGLLKQAPVINDVIRTQKTQKVVRTLLMLTKLKAAAKKQEKEKDGYKPKEYNLDDPEVKAKYDTFVNIFKSYDLDQSGEVDTKKLGLMLKSMGMSLSDNELQKMFVLLDLNGDGIVTQEEFVEWNMENEETNPEKAEEELKAFAKTIFVMFDEEGTGEITVDEFQTTLDKMNSGLSASEINAIVVDFDEDANGTISLEEFERVIETAMRGN